MLRSVTQQPALVTVGERNAPNGAVKQRLVFCGMDSAGGGQPREGGAPGTAMAGKLAAVRQMAAKGELVPPVLIFVQSKERAANLHAALKYEGMRVGVIHAGRTPKERARAVQDFRRGAAWMLVTTDLMVSTAYHLHSTIPSNHHSHSSPTHLLPPPPLSGNAQLTSLPCVVPTCVAHASGCVWFRSCAWDVQARGMDVLGVNTVLNFDCPAARSDYVHRIGRTGRAGRAGTCVTLYTEEDKPSLHMVASAMKASGSNPPAWMLALPRRHGGGGRNKRLPPKRVDILPNAGDAKDPKGKRPKGGRGQAGGAKAKKPRRE